MKRIRCSVTLAALLISLVAITAPVYAGGTVTNCANDAQFSTMLAGGGTVTFNCGTATMVLTGTKTIAANTTIDGGGKITLSGDTKYRHFVVNSGVTLTLQNIVLSSGYSTADGGSVYNNGTLNVINTIFFNNQTAIDKSGGAIVSYGPLNITNSEFANNKGGSGGAVYPRWGSVVTIKGSWFHDNETTNTTNGWGGAILVWDGPQVTVENSRFIKNKARWGGAIFNTTNSTLNVTQSLFMTNSAYTISNEGGGGAIYNSSGTAAISNSTFRDNGAQFGGALMNYVGTLTATNVTGYTNYSSNYGNFLMNQSGDTTITNSTIVSDGNGTSYGQIVHDGADNSKRVRLKNTLIDVSDITPFTQASCFNVNATSTIISDGNNLFTDGGCGNLQLSDKVNTPALLGTLADHGGGALTFLPQAASQALNNGTSVGVPGTDQRGISRPQGSGTDIGAVERCAKPPKPTLISPANGALTRKKVKLDWSDGPCFATYKLQVRVGSKTGVIVQNVNNLTVSQFKLTSLVSGTTYFWRATTVNEGGKAKSAWGTFTVK